MSNIVKMANAGNVVAEKPMNQTQLKNLERVVQGDFDELTNKVVEHVYRLRDQRLREIETQFDAGTRMEKAQETVKAAAEDLKARAKRVDEQLAKQGIGIGKDYRGNVKPVIEVIASWGDLIFTAKADAEARIHSATERLNRVCKTTINSQWRAIQRVILLQGVTGEAARDILNDMPTLDDIFQLVASELEDYADDLRTLQGQ